MQLNSHLLVRQGEDGDKVTNLFDKARRAGAEQGTAEDVEQPTSFRGAGRTLAGGTQVCRMQISAV